MLEKGENKKSSQQIIDEGDISMCRNFILILCFSQKTDFRLLKIFLFASSLINVRYYLWRETEYLLSIQKCLVFKFIIYFTCLFCSLWLLNLVLPRWWSREQVSESLAGPTTEATF